ncbi:MAG: bifunctional adenosylcobinamide kinase/adenosylcobinamide-phosphate guanylyltransferase [Cellulosilyticaceae bacterium]
MILVIGGARSGKSTFAEEKSKQYQEQRGGNVLYIATSIAFDDDMKFRIAKHREARPSTWETLEQYKSFEDIFEDRGFEACQTVLVDCMTLMVSNLLLEQPVDFDTIGYDEISQIEQMIVKEVKGLISVCKQYDKQLIVVSNEVGFGVVPPYRLGSIFRDIAGRINQKIARDSEEVYLLTAGIPMKIK